MVYEYLLLSHQISPCTAIPAVTFSGLIESITIAGSVIDNEAAVTENSNILEGFVVSSVRKL